MARKNSRKIGYSNINVVAAIVCFIVVLVVVLTLFVGSGNKSEDESQNDRSTVSNELSTVSDLSAEENTSSQAEESSEPDIDFTTISVETSTFRQGDLIVVSPDHKMTAEPADKIVPVWEKKTTDYKLSDLSVKCADRLIPNLNNMLAALHGNVSSNALTIACGYRTVAEQQDIHDSNRNSNGREPEGGCSDLNTGLSFSAWVYPSTEGKINEGKFAWLSENCHEYGYIVRYPNGKSSLTGIDASSDYYITYRYVGAPHSYLIYFNDYCLEEYIEFVMRFSVDNRYVFNREGTTYEIYYVPASEGETTELPVPTAYEYTVSGDNIGGFIVTISK